MIQAIRTSDLNLESKSNLTKPNLIQAITDHFLMWVWTVSYNLNQTDNSMLNLGYIDHEVQYISKHQKASKYLKRESTNLLETIYLAKG